MVKLTFRLYYVRLKNIQKIPSVSLRRFSCSEMVSTAFVESLCNFLSLTVVVLCVVMKVPQIWSAFKSGNTTGISFGSVLLEQAGYSVMLSYNFAMGYPVGTYLETAFLLIQNFFMIGLIIYTRDLLSPKVFIAFVIYMAVYLSIGYRLVPEIVLQSVISLCTPLGVSSKLTQILALYKKKDPGRLSAITWSIAGYGCYVRILTSLVQTGDVFILINFTCGALLNSTIVIMILYYSRQLKSKLY